MVTEMMVALMAMIAACVLQPGQYFAINAKGTPTEVVAKVCAAGFPVTEAEMQQLARELGEKHHVRSRRRSAHFRGRDGAHVCARHVESDRARALVSLRDHVRGAFYSYHARCRNARRAISAPGLVRQILATARQYALVDARIFLCSALLVAAWGWFLYQGVIDPLGGINSLWPLFGLANQLLSVIALCLGTTHPDQDGQRPVIFG